MTGLRARGGDTIDITWQNGGIAEATLHANRARTVRVRTTSPADVTANGQQVTVQRPEPTVVTFATTADTTYQLTFRPTPVVSLRSRANNQYVCAENAGAEALLANRTAIGPWEQFDLVDLGGGGVALRAHANGQYVCAEDAGAEPLIASRTAIGVWETFQRVDNANGSISLRAEANDRYVTAADGGASPLIATSTTIGTAESFDLITD